MAQRPNYYAARATKKKKGSNRRIVNDDQIQLWILFCFGTAWIRFSASRSDLRVNKKILEVIMKLIHLLKLHNMPFVATRTSWMNIENWNHIKLTIASTRNLATTWCINPLVELVVLIHQARESLEGRKYEKHNKQTLWCHHTKEAKENPWDIWYLIRKICCFNIHK